MLLVSFSSGKMLNLMMQKYITLLARKVLKIRRSPFSGTPGIYIHFEKEASFVWCTDLGRSSIFLPLGGGDIILSWQLN